MTRETLIAVEGGAVTPPTSKRARAKLQTRDRVVIAAHDLIAERGFEAATMRDIAAAADVSTGAVFASFSDKHELFDAVIKASNDQAWTLIEAAVSDSSGGVVDRLLGMFRTAYAFYLKRLRLVGACLSQAWTRPQTARTFEACARVPARQMVERLLQTGIDRGELSETLDVELTSEFVWDAYMANWRGAVFDEWTLDEIMLRTRAQLDRILCGYLRD